ncbi:NHL repeat-containing protein 2-like [Argiope bruennichi]|uniref:NHL repeat-containing protein 2-like n=1 Tax=Argiope bruennichi TaxID=94029 RepID=UPI0024950388|nr:NHL repeat-containing protein 2-like [Argiope bruennichi]
MENNSNDPCLVDLYEGDGDELLILLETETAELIRDSEKWEKIIYSHIDRVVNSPRSLKIDNFKEDFDWLNSKPLSLDKELKNKFLILDFFTYCCINCEHALPFIQQVEEDFRENTEIVVIGVHSPKFLNEKDLNSVKNAVLRNKIKHPVINDPENHLWNKLGVYCWPTVLITSPSHQILFSLVGEVQIEKLNYLCHQVLKYFKTKNTLLNTNQLQLTLLENNKETESLLFPSGISTCGKSIIVSDTGHNRLLLLLFDGKIQHVIGSGAIGHKDGSFSKASFNRPQGIAWWKSNFVFVADTGNNCIRMIDLKAKEVSTVFKRKNAAVDANFSSPWDVCIGPHFGSETNELNVLYIAVAGSHQIWAMPLQDVSIKSSNEHKYLECSPFAGSGIEECRNNSYKMKAGFAQPSGVSYSELNPGVLFIADSESSTIRSLSLKNGHVKTVVGGGLDPKDLFQYGDKDGSGYDVKLQHPLGICAADEATIYIADSYNHKIKLINDKKRECSTLAGSGIKGSKINASLLKCEFDEPSAICYSSDEKLLLIADTNNHSIKIIDPETKILKVMSLTFPDISCVDAPLVGSGFPYQDISNFRKINLKVGGKINCTFKLNQPGLSLTEGVMQPWNLSIKGSCYWNVGCRSNSLFHSTWQPSLILKCIDGSKEHTLSEIIISANLTLCDDINNICFPKEVTVKLEIEFSEEGLECYDGVFIFN